MTQIIITCPDKIHNGAWRHGIELARNFSAIEYIPTAQVMNMKIDAKLVIMIGGFCDDYRVINTSCQGRGIKTAMLFCSPFGQADINQELEQLNNMLTLLETGQINYLFTGTQSMADTLKNDKIKFLPQTLNYELFLKDTKTNNVTAAQKNSVSLFCGTQPNKNILNQIVATKQAGKTLYTNALERRNYRQFANNIGLTYYQFTWTDDEEYKRLINSCEIGLQCSWDEAFDYVIAEHYLLNKPIISGKYGWAHPDLIVDDLSDTTKIAKKLVQNYNLDLVKYAKDELDKRKKTAEQTINSLEIWKW